MLIWWFWNERLVELARRRFAMIPVGAGFWRVADVFRRVMRLRVYMMVTLAGYCVHSTVVPAIVPKTNLRQVRKSM